LRVSRKGGVMAVSQSNTRFTGFERTLIGVILVAVACATVIGVTILPSTPPVQPVLPDDSQPIDTARLLDTLGMMRDIRRVDTRHNRYEVPISVNRETIPPLLITRFMINQTPHQIDSAMLTVSNTTEQSKRGTATLIVSSSFDRAFDTVVMRTESIPFQLETNEATMIALPPILTLPPGTYTLTALVELESADGVRATSDFVIDSLTTGIEPPFTLRSAQTVTDFIALVYPDQPAQQGQTIRFTNANVETVNNVPVRVTTTVRNVTEQPQSGWAWVIAAPPFIEEPWSNAIYTAPEQTIMLEPGAETTFTYDLPALNVPDDYVISLWTHGDAQSGRFHSDGQPIDSLFNSHPSLIAEFTVLETRVSSNRVSLTTTLELQNNERDSVDSAVLLTLSPIEANDPVQGARFSGLAARLDLESGEALTFTETISLTLPDGAYRVIAWTFRVSQDSITWISSSEYTQTLIVESGQPRLE